MESNGNMNNMETKRNGVINCSSDSNVDLLQKCNCCGQFLNNSDLVFYQGHPQDAVEEFLALTNEKLGIASGKNGELIERPKTNITGFNIFDVAGHLVPIDYGLIGTDARINISGYLKPISSDSLDIDEDSVPVKDVGPIIKWFMGNLDGRNGSCITLSTELCEYNLLKPSDQYKPLMVNFYEKTELCKVVVEYLRGNYYLQPSYQELLEVIQKAVIPELNNKPLDEEILQKHSQFLYNQVVNLEENEEPLITVPCMTELVELMCAHFDQFKLHTKVDFKKVDKKAWTKATTTPLVRKTFESFFTNQLDKTNMGHQSRRKRCGICSACQSPDCGVCSACTAMAKFGGRGGSKRACERRPCTRNAASDSDDESEVDAEKEHQIENIPPVRLSETYRKIKWIGKLVQADATQVYYNKVEIDDVEYSNGDFVMLECAHAHIPALVARIVYMWKDVRAKMELCHVEMFIRSADTVLGEVGDPREVFLGNKCCHGAPLSSILRKASVEKKDIPADWFERGGKELDIETLEDDGKTYFYSKFYEMFTARFVDLPADPECPNSLRQHRFCPSCERKVTRDMIQIPKVYDRVLNRSSIVTGNRTEYNMIKWQNHEYKKGGAVFLRPGTFKLRNSYNAPPIGKRPKTEKVDEDMYPEFYRKNDSTCQGSNRKTGRPFCVAYIAAVTAVGTEPVLIIPQHMYLKVNVLYRPENTNNRCPQREHLNLLYWTDQICEVPFEYVVGPCHLTYQENIPQQQSLLEWLEQDPSRFYFQKAYSKSSGRIVNVPKHATTIGRTESGKGKGKGKSSQPVETHQEKKDEVEVRPLRSLDVFAGCGGLSDGLQRAGVAECRWAVENWEAAAHAFSLNHERCSVFTQDCNELLAEVMSGSTHSEAGVRLPLQGEVELLCGGPPCQGFSGMNRFNLGEYSNFKNSLVASFLSYCDYYRPKYFILENVRNFVTFKKGMVLKLTMRALLAMGYQCTFGVLQAGSYGLPQSRRRLFVLAAAPSLVLPLYPEPTHVFNHCGRNLTTIIDGKRFSSNIRWTVSAPRRTCTILDAISDLPPIGNGANEQDIDYESEPQSHFQQSLRGYQQTGGCKLRDHICKNMAPLVQARIDRVPTTPGSDWRDLPNIAVPLPDGTKSKVLQYRYEDKRNGRSSRGGMRGVCACAGGQPCAAADRQEHTLIPWCLPHTANRNNHWAGLYGRLEWEGYFSTTVTDPEPMGKQGRVLHPSQARVISVRECARSQGFTDQYMFAGCTLDKHRQIGNAVPPPLAAALGRAILKAYTSSL